MEKQIYMTPKQPFFVTSSRSYEKFILNRFGIVHFYHCFTGPTSNRRHLIKETLSDRTGDDIHEADTRQELMSLSARFGLTVTFQRPEKARFEVILTELAKQHGIEMPHDELLTKAEAFAIRAGGRSPRVAKQFIEQCAAGVQK